MNALSDSTSSMLPIQSGSTLHTLTVPEAQHELGVLYQLYLMCTVSFASSKEVQAVLAASQEAVNVKSMQLCLHQNWSAINYCFNGRHAPTGNRYVRKNILAYTLMNSVAHICRLIGNRGRRRHRLGANQAPGELGEKLNRAARG